MDSADFHTVSMFTEWSGFMPFPSVSLTSEYIDSAYIQTVFHVNREKWIQAFPKGKIGQWA